MVAPIMLAATTRLKSRSDTPAFAMVVFLLPFVFRDYRESPSPHSR
jgi:hypothetical protein